MFLFLLFLHFHSCSSFFHVPLFYFPTVSSISFLPISGRQHKVTTRVDVSLNPSTIDNNPSIHFSFPDDNLSRHQWIFTKLGMCIDIVEIGGLGLLMGKFRKNFTELSARDTIMAGYYSLTFLFFQLFFFAKCLLFFFAKCLHAGENGPWAGASASYWHISSFFFFFFFFLTFSDSFNYIPDLTNDDDGSRIGEEGFQCADFPDSTVDTVTFCNVAWH